MADTYTPAEMAAAILAIPGGGNGTGLYCFDINENGHLVMYYSDALPGYRINANGHLVLDAYSGYPALSIRSGHLMAEF